MVLTMAAVAVHKGITLDKLEVQIETRVGEADGRQRTTFVAEVDLGSGLNERQRRILFNSARYCEVHKLLEGSIQFEETLASETADYET